MIIQILSTMPMMVCGMLSALLALSLYDHWDKPKLRLLTFMLTATLLYLGHYVFFNHATEAIPPTDTIYCFCNLAVYPLYLMYIEELTQSCPNRSRQNLYMVPSVVCTIVVGVLYILMDGQEKAQFICLHLYQNKVSSLPGLAWWQAVVHLTAKTVFALQIPPVLITGFRHIQKYNQLVDNYYSNTEGKRIYRIKTLLTLFAVTSVMSFAFNVIGREEFIGPSWLLAVPVIVFSLLLLLIGHVGLSQQFSVKDVDADTIEDDVPPIPNSELTERIRKAVIDERLFLQPNLKISDLATQLNTNRNYIYNAINGEMGTNFSDFINQQRIDYACKLMEEHPDMSIADIMLKSGFTSTSAFYRNFKLFRDCSPRDFKKKKN